MANQKQSGNAFEYAGLRMLEKNLTNGQVVHIQKTPKYAKLLSDFDEETVDSQKFLTHAADMAVKRLIEQEPQLTDYRSAQDGIVLSLVPDNKGKQGDVRDILAYRPARGWGVGISMKRNHEAIKHPRISDKIDIGERWGLGAPASDKYMKTMKDLFAPYRMIRDYSKKTIKWSAVTWKHDLYKAALDSVVEELSTKLVTPQAVKGFKSFMMNTTDFYKMKADRDSVRLDAFNFYGTLSTPKLPEPSELLDLEIIENQGIVDTLKVVLDNSYLLHMRIHSASTWVEPSLKFDVRVAGLPYPAFSHSIKL
jgi:hypothetical protein